MGSRLKGSDVILMNRIINEVGDALAPLMPGLERKYGLTPEKARTIMGMALVTNGLNSLVAGAGVSIAENQREVEEIITAIRTDLLAAVSDFAHHKLQD